MMGDVHQIRVTPALKLVMTAVVLVALASSWFIVRAYLGTTIAENVPADSSQLATVETAVRMAPKDPNSHWRLGRLIATELHSDQIQRAVAEYEQAVSLSPNDYRFWMDLGGALEQAGDIQRAEQALRTAVKLAPAYAFPRWYLGNVLIRDGRYSDAFAELQRAATANELLQPQLFNLAWQINKTDFEAMKAAIGNSPEMRAQFAQYLAARGKFEDGLRAWNSLSEAEKKQYKPLADNMIASLAKEKRFREAVSVWNDVAPAASVRAQIGQFTDPGFENGVVNNQGVLFGWNFPLLSQLQIGVDGSQGRTGSNSLRLVFQVREKLDEINIGQLIAVEPNTEYEFECYFKTEKLLSAATPIMSFHDAADWALLATSPALPTGESDWQRASLMFKTGPKTEAVRFLINRSKCDADSPVCPIYGTVWYDDFNLKARR